MTEHSIEDVAGQLGVPARQLEALKVVEDGNSSWRLETDDGRTLVLRRYHRRATPADVSYEHTVLRHAAASGWVVPHPVTDLIEVDSALYCITAFVPGAQRADESPGDQAQRGRDLARLQLCLSELDIGQRPGWRCQHEAQTVHADIDWDECISALRDADATLAEWAAVAAEATTAELRALGAHELPVTAVHGDFASWNVHYFDDGRFAGVIDFGLTHLDSRPYELAIARSYRAPSMITAYRAEVARLGWPLNELEEAAIEPMQRAFRVDMATWFIDSGAKTGTFDLAMISRQLERTGTTAPA